MHNHSDHAIMVNEYCCKDIQLSKKGNHAILLEMTLTTPFE